LQRTHAIPPLIREDRRRLLPEEDCGGYVTILGLDLGEFKSVCCVMDAPTGDHAFATAAITRTVLHELLAHHVRNDPSSVLLVIETGDAAGWVHDLAAALGVTATVVHTCGDERWRWRRVKRKTDRDDALKLARLARLGELPHPPVHVPAPDRRQHRRLVLHRGSVVTRRTQSRNGIRAIYNQQGLTLARGNKQWTRAGLAQLRADARPLEACHDLLDLWRGRLCAELALMDAADQQLKLLDAHLDRLAAADPRVALLQTIKGVGPRLAEAVVLHIGDDPRRFRSGDHVASYAGLVPKQLDSGERVRFDRITRRGPALLRILLVESAWMVYRHNDWAQAWVAKISRGSRSQRKLAIIGLARRLLIILWGMLKSNQPFPPAEGESARGNDDGDDARGDGDRMTTGARRPPDRPPRLLLDHKGRTHTPSACRPADLD
jgi:transposase